MIHYCDLSRFFLTQTLLTLISIIYLFQVFKAAQPALLYLVPFTLLPLFMMAYLKGDLKSMWHEPFAPHPTMSAELKIWILGNWWIGETGWKCGEHHITTASFPMKNSVTFWQNIKTFRKLTTKKYFEEKRNQTQKKIDVQGFFLRF